MLFAWRKTPNIRKETKPSKYILENLNFRQNWKKKKNSITKERYIYIYKNSVREKKDYQNFNFLRIKSLIY
jgi:hypothetical protein